MRSTSQWQIYSSLIQQLKQSERQNVPSFYNSPVDPSLEFIGLFKLFEEHLDTSSVNMVDENHAELFFYKYKK